MSIYDTPSTRRQWLQQQSVTLATMTASGHTISSWHAIRGRGRSVPAARAACVAARVAAHAERIDPAPWHALAQQAVDAAHAAGAHYAEARLTRSVNHVYDFNFGGSGDGGSISLDEEIVGVGVRALFDGAWGFSASTVCVSDEVVRLARDAVDQARQNAKSAPYTVELGTYPIAVGAWTTPIQIDPFTVTIEEKRDHLLYWRQCAAEAGVAFVHTVPQGWVRFVRQERVVATSEGAHFAQTLFESGGEILCGLPDGKGGFLATQPVRGIAVAGAGWELLLDAKIDQQFLSGQISEKMRAAALIQSKPITVGRYTLVCDGATMASLVENTIGLATQLDRALGYEANASGTSYLTDPLQMVGHTTVANAAVTVTANRSAPRELATVKWDDEGVVPTPYPLVKDGLLVDFQTTREQAAWLAPYYQQHGRPVTSHGCAATESGHFMPLQQMPNLSLEPSASTIALTDLVSEVQDGILVEDGVVFFHDSQARTGLLVGTLHEIKNGRTGKKLDAGAVLYDTQELWKNVQVVGGPSSQMVVSTSAFTSVEEYVNLNQYDYFDRKRKGQPPQLTSRSVRAAAAMILKQPIIDPSRKA